MKISICIATYNGSKYIREQIDSILPQLGESDEIIISDDSSTDNTLEIVRSYKDKRIKIFSNNKFHSPIFNFENALKQAKGDYIFLSDQDDIWMENKVDKMMEALKQFSLVVSDCYVVDKDCNIIRESFFHAKPATGIMKNLIKNNYLGCCMAFRRELLSKALPFPKRIAMHDIWLGLCGTLFYKTTFIPDKLIMYRRHGGNASPTAEKSNYGLMYKLSYRIDIIFCLVKRYFDLIFNCKAFSNDKK